MGVCTFLRPSGGKRQSPFFFTTSRPSLATFSQLTLPSLTVIEGLNLNPKSLCPLQGMDLTDSDGYPLHQDFSMIRKACALRANHGFCRLAQKSGTRDGLLVGEAVDGGHVGRLEDLHRTDVHLATTAAL